jgi:magnesium-transporting ATPase (P-type)
VAVDQTATLPLGSGAAGLTESEARRRRAERGEEPAPTSRSWASIIRANTLTVFNVILLIFGVLTLSFGDWRDAVFMVILLINAGIGIVQEARAKRQLDRLAALVTPTASVVRDGEPRTVDVSQVVEGDLILLSPGDQIVADGVMIDSEGLSLDESILTGESEPNVRAVGDDVRAGSFVSEGAGSMRARAVGGDSYAQKLLGEARTFRHPRSPLERALDRLILLLTGAMIPLGILLGWSLIAQETPLQESLQTAVAGAVTVVPEGLVLLTGITFAVAATGIARKGALVQQINAIESIASADVVCLDKTGTLTEEGLRVTELIPAEGVQEAELTALLARYAASVSARNATLQAIAGAVEAVDPEAAEEVVPFSSRRRWSGAKLGADRIVLGAPEHFTLGLLEDRSVELAGQGRRVLALARAERPLVAETPTSPPPNGGQVLGLVVLAERLRPDAAETVAYLREEGVRLIVISGDAPATVSAIARDAGIPEGKVVQGSELPSDSDALTELAREVSVVGRCPPEGKKRLVEALAGDGHYVAMVGDGVNDVPALKASRLAIAQGSGAQMARAVSDVILVKGGFSVVPAMIGQGRKVLRNLQRVAKLFVAKSALAAFLILTIGLSSESYPFIPRQLSLASAFTLGIPAFFLALAPSAGPWRPTNFLRELSSFAVPAGVATGFGVVASYLAALNLLELDQIEARTIATTVLVLVGLYLIILLEWSSRVRGYTVAALCGVLLAGYIAVLSLPMMRSFFELSAPTPLVMTVAVLGSAIAILGLWLTDQRFVPGRAHVPTGDDE